MLGELLRFEYRHKPHTVALTLQSIWILHFAQVESSEYASYASGTMIFEPDMLLPLIVNKEWRPP